MQLLRLPAYFEPEQAASSFLWQNLSEDIVKAGIDEVVYTPMPTRGVSEEERNYYKTHRVETKHDGRMVVHRFHLYGEGRNPILRTMRYVLQGIIQFNKAVFARDARSCDVMFIASTPPIQGALAVLVKKFRRDHIPFVYNLQDIFPDSLAGTGLAKKGGLLWKIGRVIENFTYRNADKIIVISQDFKRNIMAKGVPEEKIEVIYNWVDENAIVPVNDEDNELFEEFGISRDKFRVVYAGNLGNAQNIGIIVDAARRMRENTGFKFQVSSSRFENSGINSDSSNSINNGCSQPTAQVSGSDEGVFVNGDLKSVYKDVQFIIFGKGGMEDEIKAIKEKEHLDNLTILPLQPYERVAKVYGLGNVCIVACKPGLGGAAMPSKTWSIMSAGRAVLANFDEGELKEIIEDNENRKPCGLFTKAGDLDGFVNAIVELSQHPERCEEMGKNGREFILKNLTREVGTKKYVEVIKSVALKR